MSGASVAFTAGPYPGAGAWDAPDKHVSIQTFIELKIIIITY